MYRIDLACLKEIARVSNHLNHQNQQRKNDDVKLTNVREDQPVFYITQVESEWQRRIFLFGSRWKTMIDRRSSRFCVFSQAVGAGKIFAQLHQSCRWLGGIFRVDKQSSCASPIPSGRYAKICRVSNVIRPYIPIAIIKAKDNNCSIGDGMHSSSRRVASCCSLRPVR